MKFTIPKIRIPSKKNSLVIRKRRDGRRFPAPSEALRRAEKAIGYAAKAQGVRPAEGPLRLSIEVSGKRGAWDLTVSIQPDLREDAKAGRYGDAEGIAQTVMDALNGVGYHDDGQVTTLEVVRKVSH